MKKMIQAVLALTALCAPAAAEPVPPGPVCPDHCTEYHCTPQGICYCRPYPQPERCGLVAGLPQSPVLASFADEPDEPAPDANPCYMECIADCGNQAAGAYWECIENGGGDAEYCTLAASTALNVCKYSCRTGNCDHYF